MKLKTFEDLEFKPHACAAVTEDIKTKFPETYEQMKASNQARIIFENGRELSVIFGTLFYSNGINTYEAMELNHNSQPLGYLTKEEVSEYMKLIQYRWKGLTLRDCLLRLEHHKPKARTLGREGSNNKIIRISKKYNKNISEIFKNFKQSLS